jgi:signal recognition particle receptor subunit beta
MALVNHAKREINAKIVFCGATGAGKATLLKAIYSRLPAENRGQLRSISFQQDKMLFFDFTHPEGSDSDKYSLRLHAYTLTGEITQENAWKMVLKGVDGVAFVADSDPLRQAANRQAFEQMQIALHSNGKRVEDLPAVVICTKQDLTEPVSKDQICSDIPVSTLPVFTVDSVSGRAVLDPLCELLEGILANLEGLGLAMQPAVNELCKLAPNRFEKTSPAILTEPLISEAPVCQSSQAADTETTSITLDGTPEISGDGSLTVGIKVSCCGKISKASLKISISNLN